MIQGLRVLALVIIVATRLPAIADTPDVRAEATAHFQAGVALVDRGNDKGALVEFEQAYKLLPDWQYLFNIGVLQRKLFRYGDAIRTFERYLADGAANVPADRRSKVETELAELRNLVGDIVLTVVGPPARIELDDVYIGDSPLPDPLVVAAGPHTLRVTRDGFDPAQQELVVVKGQRVEVALSPRERPTMARVTIMTRPVSARLRIDGTITTRSPWTGPLHRGGHRVIAEEPGYRRVSEEITVDAGQARSFTYDLVKEQPSIVRRKAFWITIGAIVVASSVAGIAYATRPEPPDVTIHWP
jgi:PEGA domain